MQQIPIKGFSYATITGQLAIICKYCQKGWRADRIEDSRNRNFLMEHRLKHVPEARAQLDGVAREDQPD
jgi:hypothetical protein